MPLSRSIPKRPPYKNDRPSLTMHRNHRIQIQPCDQIQTDPEPTTQQALYSALYPTPLNPNDSPPWDDPEYASVFRSLPVRQSQWTSPANTQLPPSENHRVVLRAQRRTRTRFTTPKNKQNTAPAIKRHRSDIPYPMKLRGMGALPLNPIGASGPKPHYGFKGPTAFCGSRAAPWPYSQALETIGFEPMTPCLQSRCSTN